MFDHKHFVFAMYMTRVIVEFASNNIMFDF